MGTLALGSAGGNTKAKATKQKTQGHTFRPELGFVDSGETLQKPNAG